MLQTLIKPLPLIFTIATTVGVLAHDTQIDRATTIALAAPVAFATFVAVDNVLKSSENHVHVERASAPKHFNALSANFPRMQPRDDDRRYVLQKKLAYTGGESISLWPSV